MSFGKNKQSSSSSSAPLTADQVASYFYKLNEVSNNRLSPYAQQGTQPTVYWGVQRDDLEQPSGAVSYKAPSADTIRSLGGLGSSRRAAIERERATARGEVNADPSLSAYQKIRANQMTDEDLRSRLDAIDKETEAAIAGMTFDSAGRDLDAQTTSAANAQRAAETTLAALQTEAARNYESNLANNRLRREDLELLANIFFGGSGNVSSSSGKGSGFNLGFSTPK